VNLMPCTTLLHALTPFRLHAPLLLS